MRFPWGEGVTEAGVGHGRGGDTSNLIIIMFFIQLGETSFLQRAQYIIYGCRVS